MARSGQETQHCRVVGASIIVWSGYALVNYKPVDIDAQLQKPKAPILPANLPKAE